MPRKKVVTERDQKILKMWGEGLTGLQIGEVLGVTRSAILGRLHRLKAYGIDIARPKAANAPLQSKPRPAPRPKPQPKQQPQSKPQPVLLARTPDQRKSVTTRVYYPPRPEPKPRKGVLLMDLKSTSCRYIISSKASNAVIFCGKDKELGSYCAHHARLCYVPRQTKKTKKSNEFTIYKYGRLHEPA